MPTNSKFQLRIASPCRAPWENMDGDDRVRFCRECNRNVYNLSAMPEPEAQRVIAEREGRLCVRFYQRHDGTVLTSDCPVGQKRSLLRAGARVAVAIAVASTGLTKLSACGPSEDEASPTGEPLMGTPPVDLGWDAGTMDDEPEDPERPIMGEIAIEQGPARMGKIAAPIADD